MVTKKSVKFLILFKQNVAIFITVVLWFVINYVILYIENGFNTFRALELTFYITEGPSDYDTFYYRYGDYVMFSLVLGMVNVEIFRHYHPRKTCETLASKMENHAVVFGYTDLGMRIKSFLEKNKVPWIVVSPNDGAVEDLIANEAPVIIHDESDEELMAKTRMAKAKYVFLCDNNNFYNLNILIEIRKVNKSCTVVARVLDDHLVPIYESYGCHAIATSGLAARNVFEEYVTPGTKAMHFIGFNDYVKAFIDMAIAKGIECHCVEKDSGDITDFEGFYSSKTEQARKLLSLTKGDYLVRDVLQNSGVLNAQVIIITEDIKDDLIHVAKIIRDVNPSAKVIVRCFSDDIAKIFETLGCITISTSRYELEDEIKPLLTIKK
ncbi:MAG: NAD-binding protein [Candidatus Sigynarchaeota archaeon]